MLCRLNLDLHVTWPSVHILYLVWVGFIAPQGMLGIYNLTMNSLIPKSDKHLISPYNITPKSHIQVVRIKEMVTN